MLGQSMEPAILRKKKPIPIQCTSTTKMFPDALTDDYVLLGNNQKFSDNIRYRNFAGAGANQTSPTRLSSSAHDEFMLLGGNQKFAKNIEYRDAASRKFGKTYVQPSANTVDHSPVHTDPVQSERKIKPPPKVQVDTGRKLPPPRPAAGKSDSIAEQLDSEPKHKSPPKGSATKVLNGAVSKPAAQPVVKIYNKTTKSSMEVPAPMKKAGTTGGPPKANGRKESPKRSVTRPAPAQTSPTRGARESRKDGTPKASDLVKGYTYALKGAGRSRSSPPASHPSPKEDGDKASSTYAFKYRAGVAPPRPAKKRKSEYQLQYSWKKAIKEASPMLAAENIIHNNNPQLAPVPSDNQPVVSKKSEYAREFKSWAPHRKATSPVRQSPRASNENNNNNAGMKKAKSMSALSVADLPPAGVPSRILMEADRLKQSMNPQKPFFPHGPQINWRSEYNCNFQSPTKFKYEQGSWQGAAPPHLQYHREEDRPVAADGEQAAGPSSWFAEVVELRKKAEEYRLRSSGTHFSRQHMAQLLAEQSRLWDEVSVSDTLSALSLEPAQGSVPQGTQTGTTSSATTARSESSMSKYSQQQEQSSRRKKSDSSPDRAAAQKRSPAKGSHVNRRLAWDELETAASPSVSDSIKSIPSGSSPSELTVQDEGSSSSTITGGGGRVGTPELRRSPVVQRHHLDLTTPARGGALLVKSPKRSKNRRQKSQDFGSPNTDQSCNCQLSAEAEQRPACVSPTFGQRTVDTHALLDETASYDKVLETRYINSPQPLAPQERMKKTDRRAGLQAITEAAGQTYNVPLSPGSLDDSSSVCSRASSRLSMASDLLDKARSRRDQFWGPGAKAK